MVKVLSNRVLAFDGNDRDAKGNIIRVKTVIGFCTLPDWVAETDYFKAAIKDKSLQLVSTETSVSDQQRIADLEKELAEIKLRQDKAAANVTPADFLEEVDAGVKKETKKKNVSE